MRIGSEKETDTDSEAEREREYGVWRKKKVSIHFQQD